MQRQFVFPLVLAVFVVLSSPSAKAQKWVDQHERGDWGMRDRGGGPSVGSKPSSEGCTNQFLGQVAVCWPGSCTYKNETVTLDTPRDGPNPGDIFLCSTHDDDQYMQIGTFRIQSTPEFKWGSPAFIRFPKEFGSVPQVSMSFETAVGRDLWLPLTVAPQGITTKGFKPNLSRENVQYNNTDFGLVSEITEPLTVSWIAVGSRLLPGDRAGGIVSDNIESQARTIDSLRAQIMSLEEKLRKLEK
jgi:hypothetical protein